MPREFDATNTSSIALWSDDGFQVFGYELEVNGLSVNDMNNAGSVEKVNEAKPKSSNNG